MEEYLANLKTLGQIYRELWRALPRHALVQVVRLVERPRVEIEGRGSAPLKISRAPPVLF
jgi:hypothetical protein